MLLGAIVTVVACRRPSSEPSAPPPAVPRFTPQFHASLLPPFFRSLKFGDTTLPEAAALLPAANRSFDVTRLDDPRPGACRVTFYREALRALTNMPMATLDVDSRNARTPDVFGTDFSGVRLCFAALPGRTQPVLIYLSVRQEVIPGHAAPPLCAANARLNQLQPLPDRLCELGYRCIGDRSGFFAMGVRCDELPAMPGYSFDGRFLQYFLQPLDAQPGLPSPLPDSSPMP